MVKLGTGSVLITKTAHIYGNGVVLSVKEGKHRNVVTVLTDFGNIVIFPSEQDVLEFWDVDKTVHNIHNRLERQIELLTKALEDLNNGSTMYQTR